MSCSAAVSARNIDFTIGKNIELKRSCCRRGKSMKK
jgi:hypothetical protein